MSGVNDCPRCGADMVLPERVCIICLQAENTRLKQEAGESMRGSGLLTAMNDELRAENNRLKAERDALLAAAKAVIALEGDAPVGCDCSECRTWAPLRLAVASCSDAIPTASPLEETKPEHGRGR